MIKINKKSRKFKILRSDTVINHLEKSVIAKNTKPTGKYYRGEYKDKTTGQTIKEVAEALAEDAHYKCAYCEKELTKPQVEHYRPHGSCYDYKDEQGKRVATCLKNDSSIIGSRLNPRYYLYTKEEPLLLNPETDNLDNHFEFNSKGFIIPISEKGHISKELYDLNRGDLIKNRQEIIKELIDDLQFNINLFNVTKDYPKKLLKQIFEHILAKIKKHQNPKETFTALANFVVENFDTIIKTHLKKLTPITENILDLAKKEIFT